MNASHSRYLLSEKFSPWMHVIAAVAEQVRKNRVAAPEDSPLRAVEREFDTQVMKTIESAREFRDKMEEATFQLLYGALVSAKPQRNGGENTAGSRSLRGETRLS